MPTRPTPACRRALAAVAVTVALGAGGLVVATPSGAQTDPVPSTEPVPAEGVEDPGTGTTVAEGAGADAAVEEAQRRADADLRSVWIVVAALGTVAVGLLVLLVLYVRATNPERAARRRAALVARAEERRRARGGARDGELGEVEAAVDDEPPDDEPMGGDDRTELVGVAAPGAAALTRDPDGTGDGAVRVLDAAPAGASPAPADADETVRVVPAPSGPSAVPASARRGAVVAAGPGAAAGDRPPPRSLVDGPPPPRRPRRVEAPAKKLGTPDAERVLVRPGQTPVRVPPTLSRPGPAEAGDAPDGDVTGDGGEGADAPGGDGAR